MKLLFLPALFLAVASTLGQVPPNEPGTIVETVRLAERCFPDYPLSDDCPDDCAFDSECGDGYNCEKTQCGGCHCYLEDSGPPKDCCFDKYSYCNNMCEYDEQCPMDSLCKEDPDCEGGCICDSGEVVQDCRYRTNLPDGCPQDCNFDGDCPRPGQTCEPTSCGGCECVRIVHTDCCENFYIDHRICRSECEFHSQCGTDGVCTRSGCGGCSCDVIQTPDWADCYPDTNIYLPFDWDPTEDFECPDECRTHQDCWDMIGGGTPLEGIVCRSNGCGKCECWWPWKE